MKIRWRGRRGADAGGHKPIDGIALAKEVFLERLEQLLVRMLERLRAYRARRAGWHE